MTPRQYRGSASFYIVILVVAFSAFYVTMEMDLINSAFDLQSKSEISGETSAATSGVANTTDADAGTEDADDDDFCPFPMSVNKISALYREINCFLI